VLAVPGFGPATSRGLLDWRRRLESRFIYSTQTNEMDRKEFAKISVAIHTKASKLRRTLLAGAANLSNVIARTRSLAALKDNQLLRIHAARQQLIVDLEYLGVPKSALAQQTPSTVSAAPTPSLTPASRTQQSQVTCPRCGSPMIRRTAHRGRNAGNPFWGCSRYPLCKGTRN
jgi:predicted RNA-binding Zn-ribbon protein involved in translation (DUF1610 family)